MGIVLEQTDKKGENYSCVFFNFLFIMAMNFFGLVPFGFTLTGHVVVTFSLSIGMFIAWIIRGFTTLGLKFFKIFLPSGLPMWLIPLVVIIEILSFIIRPISLAIRLFANMLAGHILLFIIATALITILKMLLVLSILPAIVIALFTILEIGICFLQAYVYTILLCIYLSDSLSIKH